MELSHSVQTNLVSSDFITMQLSYSTADLQQCVFYGNESEAAAKAAPTGKVTFVVIHGEVHPLVDAAPDLSIPFTADAGLLKMVGIDKQAP